MTRVCWRHVLYSLDLFATIQLQGIDGIKSWISQLCWLWTHKNNRRTSTGDSRKYIAKARKRLFSLLAFPPIVFRKINSALDFAKWWSERGYRVWVKCVSANKCWIYITMIKYNHSIPYINMKYFRTNLRKGFVLGWNGLPLIQYCKLSTKWEIWYA